MARLKKILLVIIVVILLLVGTFLLVIGPWPVYRTTDFKSARYYQKSIDELQASARKTHISDSPGLLKAGWSSQIITPPIGTPLGGYSARNGKPSTGVHDELYAKAIALSDGEDTVVIVGTDLLLVPPNIAEKVRQQVGQKTPLTSEQLYFTASHTHCGPGAWAPGVAGKITGGKYNPAVVEHLAKYIAEAIIEAYNKMEPAKIATGNVDAGDFIRNRTRKEPVDSDLNFMVVEQNSGNRCYVVRFSAHPTNYDDDMMQFSAEYPGALQRFIEHQPKTTAIYLGGALGSSGPRAPDAPDAESRVLAMGNQLGQLVLDNSQSLTFEDHVEVASFAFLVYMPPFQVRPVSIKWRLSPLAGKIMGVPPYGWFQACRVGDVLLVGLPFDFSGEISRVWKMTAGTMDIDLWTTSFSGAYCGYLSPDRYYWQEPLNYETGLMSWFGPSCEAFMKDLFEKSMLTLFPNIKQAGL
ncbi:MAG TPA: neutral/alkaline non-lysosomal ceramidase N-terminal domain-containing protein [Candidatus Hydrogenedens sp.]|nr:neutral/alkaline non-lysosomal ceramidase N-terminal domain-containing protein [Candidatus Hydrogenedens sp.]HOK09180.1 neutral/alkaline non-lysosomal ceramidase N-terminal domain-containing protein [Candidatus Hydrogenedens sp.]HOL19226.1 neutral/alkaline non-lysosomal ceramidase N-terminal domain-containing protein [Candidatus Hydrogenedens sp.]HPP58947.1 neutral/alkaline non-lysosomal ceramidase N-terminal domain-containing protein [Candidatus Hydrogenedens sp.]